MGVTFNTTDGIQGGVAGAGLYAHIVAITGPRKIPAQTDPVLAEYWTLSYEVAVHKDQSTRNADHSGWGNRVVIPMVDRFKWTAPNLDTQPTLPVLYAHLKTELGNISGISSIADVI